MILLKAFFLNDLVISAGVAPEFVHACALTHTHTLVDMCEPLRSSTSHSWKDPAAGILPSQLLEGQLVCHNNIALPSCHFTREKLKHKCRLMTHRNRGESGMGNGTRPPSQGPLTHPPPSPDCQSPTPLGLPAFLSLWLLPPECVNNGIDVMLTLIHMHPDPHDPVMLQSNKYCSVTVISK